MLQQALCLHCGFDTVEDDADARRKLLEEREVRWRECIERCKFDHGLHPVLEQDGKHNDVAGYRFK